MSKLKLVCLAVATLGVPLLPAGRIHVAEPRAQTTSAEQRALDLTNQARRAAGVPEAAFAADLLAVARAHCRDMNARCYLAHASPEGQQLPDRLKAAGIRCVAAAENIALVGSSDPAGRAHELWMRSTDHRRNIIDPAFSECAVGVVPYSEAEGYYFLTQVLIAREAH